MPVSPGAEVTLIEFEPWYLHDTICVGASFGRLDEYRNPKIEALAKALGSSVQVEGHQDAVLAGLSAALCRALAITTGTCATRQDDARINPNALRRVLSLVEDQIGRDLRVDMLAATSGLSPSAFLRAFRGSTGATPGDFVTSRRMSRAEALLKGTDLPIAEIARRCGFGSAAHFSSTFRARRGLQPGALRRATRLATPVSSRTTRRHDDDHDGRELYQWTNCRRRNGCNVET